MAKIGAQMLPMAGPVPAQPSSDSEVEQGALAAYPYQQQSLLLPPGAHSYPTAPVPTATSAAVDMQLPLLLSETRSQNTEVRLNISKLADKVDAILGKDNEKLKNDNSEKDHKIQGLNEKICDLLQKNQRLMEESNSMFEQRSDALHSSAANSQARLLALETEKMEATERLAQALSALASLRAELSERQQKECQAQKELEELRSTSEGKADTLKSLEDSLKEKEELRKHLEETQRQEKELRNATYIYEKKVAAANESKELEKLKQLQQENQASGVASTSTATAFDFEAELKKIMNVLFKLLQREFSSQETYSRKEALQIILTIIRGYTTEVLQKRQAPSTSNESTSKSSPASTASNSSTGSPPASGPTSAAASAPASETAAPQLPKNLGETEKVENKNHGSPETPPATEEPSSTPSTGPAGDDVSSHCSEPVELAPEDSNSKFAAAKLPETGAEEPGQLNVPVVQADEEKDAADSTKEKGSGDAGLCLHNSSELNQFVTYPPH
ncbi:hypothetical protein HPB52_019664 [Rhipicephalus sanguineus]|uniref:FK506-binding protein 15-like domain-containing protein n=1 Tax=Rhipicephalus sanguineus TaxID=34632 RepID=A0A9D4TBD6_RHISA|nr:hypothetical protein HPB52_019664 [Rhipicephalus sanguineus]